MSEMRQEDFDALYTENEELRARVEELETELDHLRFSERHAREAAITPAELVTLKRWSKRDDIPSSLMPTWRKKSDFPSPVLQTAVGRDLYDLDALRQWKAEKERRRAKRKERRLEESRQMREDYGDEMSQE